MSSLKARRILVLVGISAFLINALGWYVLVIRPEDDNSFLADGVSLALFAVCFRANRLVTRRIVETPPDRDHSRIS